MVNVGFWRHFKPSEAQCSCEADLFPPVRAQKAKPNWPRVSSLSGTRVHRKRCPGVAVLVRHLGNGLGRCEPDDHHPEQRGLGNLVLTSFQCKVQRWAC